MKKIILASCGIIILFLGLVVYDYSRFYDGKLHIVFCDVGQGDGIFIRTPSEANILIDAGPNNKIISCLNNHMPFWDRTISLAILTHPHADHFAGFNYVFKKYNVLSFATEKLSSKTLGFQMLLKEINDAGLKINYIYDSDSFRTGNGLNFRILAPKTSFLLRTSPNDIIGESKEFSSLIMLISYYSFSAILTGDSQEEELLEAVKEYKVSKLSVFQVPHHGSRTGIGPDALDEIKPSVAVISVGLKNRYGHPSSYILNLLRDYGIKTLRTDLNGEIEVISDGKNWAVQKFN